MFFDGVLMECCLGRSASSPTPRRSAESLSLSRLRRLSSSGHCTPDRKNSLDEVVKLRGWDQVTAPYIRREQIDVASERHRRLKCRYLFTVACLGGLYAFLLYSSLQAQVKRWQEQPHADIALTGPEGSALFPSVVSFWYLFLAYVATRRMEPLKPVESFIFEAMIFYHIVQAVLGAYVATVGLREAWTLGLRVVGNPAPVRGVENHRLAITAILHYHLRIIELVDTFFLICLKKIGRSSKLHVVMRLQNVWGWHIACRLGCGGDIYFPLVANGISSTALHARYASSLLGAHVSMLRWPFGLLPGRSLATAIQICVLYLCLLYGIASFLAGVYPRSVLIVFNSQVLVGVLLLSNFHYERKAEHTEKKHSSGQCSDREDWDEAEGRGEAKLTFSFDSSGWCYLYHFGVGLWIQQHFADEIAMGELVFSGSSGGAIAAAMLAANVDFAAVIDSVLQVSHLRARFKPWLVPGEMYRALERFFPEDAHLRTTNQCRVLLTRVLARPPFVMGEIAYIFKSREELIHILMATCHMPFIFGLGYVLNGARYIDGFLWGSSFVPWRSFGGSQRVCRVSAFGAVGSRVAPRWTAIPPFWWPVFPPSRDALEGLMWAGYHDVAAVFGTRDHRKPACGPCSRRLVSEQARSTEDQRIKQLINTYECTAQQHWAIAIGIVSALTVACVWFWLRFITGSGA